MSEPASPAPAAPAPEPAAPAPAPAPAEPAAPAPAEPTNQPAAQPQAPAQPAQPAEPAQPAQQQLTPEQQAEKDEEDEWAAAEGEVFPGIKSVNKEGDKNEPTKPEESTQTPAAQPPAGEEAQPGAEQPQPGEAAQPEAPAPDFAARDARLTQAQVEQQRQEFVSDIRTKLAPNMKDTLTSQDGDPINTVEDLMQYINNETGEPFTREEAQAVLPQMQANFKQQHEAAVARLNEIADANLAIQQDVPYILSKYDNVFKTIPGLQKGMFEGYLKTVKLDEATKIITDTPVTVADYYEPVLQIVSEYLNQNGGAAQPAAPAAPAAPATPQPTPEDAAKAKAEEDAKRRRARADRGDIFTPGGNEQPGDEDDKEWDTAMKNVFGPNQ